MNDCYVENSYKSDDAVTKVMKWNCYNYKVASQR